MERVDFEVFWAHQKTVLCHLQKRQVEGKYGSLSLVDVLTSSILWLKELILRPMILIAVSGTPAWLAKVASPILKLCP